MSNDPATEGHDGPGSDFDLPLVRGGSRSLRETLAGHRGAVVVFWSSVCSHCVRYDDYLNSFTTRHPALSLLAVAAREHETPDQLEKAHTQRKLQFPLVHDADRTVAHRWRIRQTPTALLVDPAHRVIYRGAIDNFKYPQDPAYQPHLERAIEAFLDGREPERSETATFGCPVQSVYYDLPKPLGTPPRSR